MLFHGIGWKFFQNWEGMRLTFLKKYQDYFQARDLWGKIFEMTQKEEESLEDYVERFQYNLRWFNQHQLDPNTVQIVFLRGIWDECLGVLNLTGVEDVSQLSYYAICNNKKGRGHWESLSRVIKSSGGAITQVEIENFLDKFKIDILSSLSSQLDTMKIKKKQDEEGLPLDIFF